MAIANGTCVSFCNQPRYIIWLPDESHAGMSLPTAVRRLQDLATSRQSKAHFGLPEDSMLVKCLAAYTHLFFNHF